MKATPDDRRQAAEICRAYILRGYKPKEISEILGIGENYFALAKGMYENTAGSYLCPNWVIHRITDFVKNDKTCNPQDRRQPA